MKKLKYVGITQGATEKARSYSHVFIEGSLYGGKIGTMLCRKPWKSQHVYQKGEVMRDLCPMCKDRLELMAKLIANHRPSELFLAASDKDAIAPVTTEDIAWVLTELRKAEETSQSEYTSTMLFADEEVAVKVKRTELTTWKPSERQPLSLSVDTTPLA